MTGDDRHGSDAIAVYRLRRCPVCQHVVPEAETPGPNVASGDWSQAKVKALDVFDHWSGTRQGWPTASAQTLLALLLFASARDRRQPVADVPWSAARVRLLATQESLRFYLLDTLTRIGDDAARHAAAALRQLHFHHQYDGWESSDGLSSDPGPDPNDYFHHGREALIPMLDASLLAERGGWLPGTVVQATIWPNEAVPENATIVAPIWQPEPGFDADPSLLDLAPGPPAGYAVRALGYLDCNVSASAVTGEAPPAARAAP